MKLYKQALFYKSKYIYLSDQSKYKKIKKEIDNDKINILDDNKCSRYAACVVRGITVK